VNVETSLPYRLIDAIATRSYRRQLGEILLPAAPPAIALAIALGLGLLPIELAVAAAITAGIVMLYASGLAPSKIQAARFLDHSLCAKDHFLTLATAAGERDLLTVVEADAAAIASHASHEGSPRLPPARKRPFVASLLLSLFAFALLWLLPRLSSLASTGGGGLEQIAAELAASGDAELARALGEVSRALRDPKLSNEEKRAKVDEALRKLDAAERKQAAGAGSSGGGGQKGDQNQQQKGEQAKGRGEQGEGSGSQKQQASGQGGGSGEAHAKAKQELSKIAGELAGAAQKAEKGESAKQQQQPSGGGIQGPESGAEERKPGERESTGNQPGKNPDKPGGNQKPGGDPGASQAGGENQPDRAEQAVKPGSGAGTGGQGAGQRSSSQADAKPAERYYKAGEGPDGAIVDGRYVRVRVPEENQQLPGSERVAKPGDASPQTPYGNAPLPPPGAPGEIGAEQPVPLEYRDAFKTGS
jgi:hypothetical protein